MKHFLKKYISYIMHHEFIKWLSEQNYRYYKGDPLNDDTEYDWILDEVIEFSVSYNVWTWEEIVYRTSL